MKRKTTITVLGKEIQRGFFGGNKHIIVMNVKDATPNPHSLEVPIEQYYMLQVGQHYTVTMYQHSDRRWYFQPEYEDT